MTGLDTPFWLGNIEVTPDANRVVLNGRTQRLPPRLMSLFCLLAKADGETMRREDLVNALWPRGYVNDEALSRAVAELRQALGDDARQPRFIETVPKRGYRLLVPVSHGNPEGTHVMKPLLSRRALPLLIATLFLVLASAWWLQQKAQSPVPNTALLATAIRVTSDQTLKMHPELSADGVWMAFLRDFAGRSELVVVPTAKPTEQQVYGFDGGARSPVFAPDPGTLALASFESGRCQVMVLSLSSGERTPLGDCLLPGDAPILDWSSDGRWLAFVRPDPDTGSASVWRISLADGAQEQLSFPPDAYTFDTSPRFSPDGRRLSFTRGTPAARELWVQKLQSDGSPAPPEQLTFDHQYISSHDWRADSTSVVLDSERSGHRALWQLNLDGQWTLLGARDAQFPTVAGDRLAFRIAQYEANIWRITMPETDAGAIPLIASTKYDSNPVFSPDGQELAFASNRTGNGAIWLAAADGSRQRVLYEPSQGRAVWPNWSPDGQHIIATRYSNRGQDLIRIALNRLEIQLVPTGGERPYGGAWSTDGHWIIYIAGHGTVGTRLWRQAAEGESTPEIWVDRPINRFATDQRWLYFSLHGEPGLYRLPLETAGHAEPQPVLPDLPRSAWDDWVLYDGWIYYPDSDEMGVAALVRINEDGLKERVSQFVPTALGPSLAVHPGGDYLLMARTDRVASDLFLSTLTVP